MVSKHRMAEYVRDHMESIKWREGDLGGFTGRLHDALVHISGSDLTRITLTISADNEVYSICEPQPIAFAPIGKAIESIKINVFKMEPTKLEPELQAAQHLKSILADIVKYAASQVLRKYEDPQWERKVRGRIWSRMTGEFEQ